MKRLILPGLLCLSLVVGAANADSIPRYDVESHCTEVASITGDLSNSLYNSCIQMEQSSYDHLKGAWSSIPANIRGGCDDVATVGGSGSYSLLESCVQMESQAASNKKSFSFD
ncbi:hypothetical protein [Salinicola acroporae]|uniref:Lysozyme inhibitor LprI N-terminal domain-containing protein n=1 Tax=Salinicola acroporae TaxID=1541440 RepID=A0ABT6I083_9GAMM|nr:hypothetical protein [Salinicola acroporae]MDH4571121.1 hypothetical protein [Salinicola acroporae]